MGLQKILVGIQHAVLPAYWGDYTVSFLMKAVADFAGEMLIISLYVTEAATIWLVWTVLVRHIFPDCLLRPAQRVPLFCFT